MSYDQTDKERLPLYININFLLLSILRFKRDKTQFRYPRLGMVKIFAVFRVKEKSCSRQQSSLTRVGKEFGTVYILVKCWWGGEWCPRVKSKVKSILTNLVNTNTKYKEDNFTDSDAVDYFQDVWTYFRWSAHMSPSLLRSPPTPLYTSQPLSQVRRVGLVTQGASWLLHDDDTDTQLATGRHSSRALLFKFL